MGKGQVKTSLRRNTMTSTINTTTAYYCIIRCIAMASQVRQDRQIAGNEMAQRNKWASLAQVKTGGDLGILDEEIGNKKT